MNSSVSLPAPIRTMEFSLGFEFHLKDLLSKLSQKGTSPAAADPDFEPGGGGGGVLFFLQSFLLFSCKIRREPGPLP